MADEFPEFQLRLPNGGPVAHGRLLKEIGLNGSHKFRVLAGSPARSDTSPSFPRTNPSSHRSRAALISDESLATSTRWPGFLEVTEDIDCNSASAAAEIILGRNSNGQVVWKTSKGHPLGDYLAQDGWGRRRTWLVRAAHAYTTDFLQQTWLQEGCVSLEATRFDWGTLNQGMSKDALRSLAEEVYESTLSYSARRRVVDEFYIFLSRMKPDDGVCTISGGMLHIGKITGPIARVGSESGNWHLQRPVEWENTGYVLEELPEEVQQKLSVQQDVADLTSVQAMIDGLGRTDEELADEVKDAVESAATALAARRELELPEPDDELARELLVHDAAWLREVRDLLWDERQLVFYGPPGTGKTYLAQKLAEFLGGGREQVKLVQFHPSYAYEDFFEGFRPQEDPETRQVAFRLAAGPLRELADLASSEGNRHVPHFLIIDEMNRANLAKVFGELYFLLEYRNRSVRLTYSNDDFALPPNLFVIGTMNTADRSIALVDAAMRRRFAFVELSPRTEPTKGVLRRWLATKERDTEPADLLDELNRRIPDPDFQIGPSYLMKPGVYREGGLERTWRTKILPLLEEYHYGEDVRVEQRYGLTSLRESITPPQA
ncbi:DUF4357 domain-containing protein [Actinomadura sp. NAK00032]|uniref:DUF4357 domain-containing protein n=1 Tax=Actinomadura sp. NAK00032 TaxID=2742128 RepID=UPI0015905FF1|nr:DUF4357 domain-containing protein [Actinomadura sp. NAK00032]QKW32872.1 DUF4357 domain-containing protein [Actinomadura sp. NAK00032]